MITQSPNDLPDEVPLVNNWVVYKVYEATIRRIKSHIPIPTTASGGVRSLGPGQALMSFTPMRRPVIRAVAPTPARLLMTDRANPFGWMRRLFAAVRISTDGSR